MKMKTRARALATGITAAWVIMWLAADNIPAAVLTVAAAWVLWRAWQYVTFHLVAMRAMTATGDQAERFFRSLEEAFRWEMRARSGGQVEIVYKETESSRVDEIVLFALQLCVAGCSDELAIQAARRAAQIARRPFDEVAARALIAAWRMSAIEYIVIDGVERIVPAPMKKKR